MCLYPLFRPVSDTPMEPVPSTSSSETATSRDPTAILSDKSIEAFKNSCLIDANQEKSEFCGEKTDQYSIW
nr:unnamed protein product [Callosobruchus analis]